MHQFILRFFIIFSLFLASGCEKKFDKNKQEFEPEITSFYSIKNGKISILKTGMNFEIKHIYINKEGKSDYFEASCISSCPMTTDLVVNKEMHGFTTKWNLSGEIKDEEVFNVDIIFDVGAMRSEGSTAKKK